MSHNKPYVIAILALSLSLLTQQLAEARSHAAYNSNTCTDKLFWFMAITSRSELEYWHYAKVAVLSAQEHSPNLVPVMLYGGWGGPPDDAAKHNILWFREHGGIVYHHNLTFMPDLQEAAKAGLRAPDWPEEVEGTYLRMDIPGIVPHLLQQLDQHRPGLGSTINQELVLYTDADVMFYHEFNPCKLQKPEVMAIGPEMDRIASSWSEVNWNAGVLLINVQGFGAVWPDMLMWAHSRQWDFDTADQSMLNEYFPQEYGKDLDILPEAYNWKGYWGCSPDIVIVHWHGPKPERCLNCYFEHLHESLTNKDAIASCNCPYAYNYLWGMAVDSDKAGLYKRLIADQKSYFTAAEASTPLIAV